MKKFFELNKPYKFDPTDVSATMFVIATVLGLMGINATIPFFIGSAISTVFCWKAHRLNLVILNLSLFVLNLYNLIQMFT